jgi:hypothetical protein
VGITGTSGERSQHSQAITWAASWACTGFLRPSIWLTSFPRDLFPVPVTSYSQGVAGIPKLKVDPKQLAILAIVAAVIGLLINSVLTLLAMLVAGIGWRSGPRWARLTLVIGAVVVIFLTGAGHHVPVKHS